MSSSSDFELDSEEYRPVRRRRLIDGSGVPVRPASQGIHNVDSEKSEMVMADERGENDTTNTELTNVSTQDAALALVQLAGNQAAAPFVPFVPRTRAFSPRRWVFVINNYTDAAIATV